MGDKNSTTKQARISDHIAYAIYRIFESFLRLLPMEIVCIIGSAMGQITYFLMSERRQVVIRNLRIVYGHSRSPQEIRALAKKTFRLSGLNLISSISASTLSTEELLDRVEVEGRDHLINAINQDSGCILLLAHMGNWELLTQLHILVPEIEALASLYRPLDNPLLDRLVKRRRQRSGTQLFSKRDGFSKPISHLKTKGTLGVIADQNAGRQGVAVPLFGKLSSMTYLPALLHRKTKAPIIPVSMCTLSPGKWKVVLHPAVEMNETDVKDTYQVTNHCTSVYEKILSESPADVLWMHNYWRIGQRRPLHIDGLQKGALGASINQPFRVLVYTGEHNSDAREIVEQLGRLKNYRSDIHITTAGKHPVFPAADHHIACDPDEPPHLTSNAIRAYDQGLPAPLDCALDFTEDSAGGKLLAQAELYRIFCRQGKWISRNTRAAITEHTSLSIAQFLTSIGLDDNSTSH